MKYETKNYIGKKKLSKKQKQKQLQQLGEFSDWMKQDKNFERNSGKTKQKSVSDKSTTNGFLKCTFFQN